MKTTTLRKGEGLSDLVDRLYASGVDRKAAEKRLVEANPHLRQLDKEREGLLVLVPELRGAKTKKGSGESSPPGNEVLESLMGLLQAARAEFERSALQQKDDLETSRQALKTEAFKEAVGSNPELKKRLPEVNIRLKERSTAIDDFKQAQRSILSDLDKDLRTMIEVVRSGPKPKVPVPASTVDEKPDPRVEQEPSRKAETKEAPPTERIRGRSKRVAYHITYDSGEGRWRILEAGNPRPLSVHDTKKEAVDTGRKIAQDNRPSQIFIHKQDGVIQEERTYGGDPPETKG